MTRKIEQSILDNLIKRYLAGESEKKLAAEISMSRPAFRQRLLKHGVTPRNRSEGMIARWRESTDEQRVAMTANAHASVRGKPQSFELRARQAITRERNIANSPIVETILANVLRDNGLPVTLHKAIGKYNVDVAVNVPPIAVEIFGGGWHAYGRHAARFLERTKYLLDSGWNVVIIWLDARRYPFSLACADYVIAFADELRLNPTARGQYRVILGDGNLAPIRENHLNTPAIVERLCGSV